MHNYQVRVNSAQEITVRWLRKTEKVAHLTHHIARETLK